MEYQDAKGRTYEIRLTTWSAMQVLEKTGINLPALMEDNGKILADLWGDWAVSAAVAYTLLADQVGDTDDDKRSFYEGIDESSRYRLLDAISRAAVNFTPDLEVRSAQVKVYETTLAIQQEASRQAKTQLAELDIQSTAAKVSAYASSTAQSPE